MPFFNIPNPHLCRHVDSTQIMSSPQESQTKTGHPWDVMGSHHGPLAMACWYQHHGKTVPNPSAPTLSIGCCCHPLRLVWVTSNWWGWKVSKIGSPCFSCYFTLRAVAVTPSVAIASPPHCPLPPLPLRHPSPPLPLPLRLLLSLPSLPLHCPCTALPVDCCLFTPPVDGGGLGASRPLLPLVCCCPPCCSLLLLFFVCWLVVALTPPPLVFSRLLSAVILLAATTTSSFLAAVAAAVATVIQSFPSRVAAMACILLCLLPPRQDGGAPCKIPNNGGNGNIPCVVREFGTSENRKSAAVVIIPLTSPPLLPPSDARRTLLAAAAPTATVPITTTALEIFIARGGGST